MALTNRDRVGKAMDLLAAGLAPYVEREMKLVRGPMYAGQATPDPHKLLAIIWEEWEAVFKRILGRSGRTIVAELREVRNKWAHMENFSTDDAYRAIDSVGRLLLAISAKEAGEVENQKQELLRVRFDEQARTEKRKAAAVPTEGQPRGELKPWREIITPHPDVASGRYQQAEFAADLWQVYLREGSDEYKDPVEFYRRTFLTEGLRKLLTGGIRRITGKGGDPVVELQTNFGGGKTHSMLALFHLFSGVNPAELPGLEAILKEERVKELPTVNRAVVVGTRLSPGQPSRKSDGTMVRTMWGEIAWQLGGKKGFEIVKEADATSTSPGDALRELFSKFSPALILIDEWVAYARGLHDENDLAGGTFDSQFTFAQILTEAAKAAKNVLLVVSIPASNNEVGGERGQAAVEKLKNAIGRIESPWRPATGDETFEIVRRRLFQDIADTSLFPARDAVIKGFGDLYRSQAAEFPSDSKEADYERRMRLSYPIHPELFDRLDKDWSALDKFQRTRGVLRLMAAVISELWDREDRNLLIMPATVPVEAATVHSELMHYLDDPWSAVIDKDVDGPNSLSLRLDRENAPNLGRFSACRRVARTVFIGSAPSAQAAGKGIDEKDIKLGCIQPGEPVPTFGDALRRLSDQSTYLYVDNGRYWYATQPTVTKLADERAGRYEKDVLDEEIRDRLRRQAKARDEFEAVHACPSGGIEVPDDPEARLVLLGPECPHSAKLDDSPARVIAGAILEARAAGPRSYRNALAFVAPDRQRLEELHSAVRKYLAWDSLDNEKAVLNLDEYQRKQVESKLKSANEAVDARIPETYQWLLVPGKKDPKGPDAWEEARLSGDGSLAARAARKMKGQGSLITDFGGIALRHEIDKIPLWRGDHVSTHQLAEDFFKYLYLSRIKDAGVLVRAIEEGVGILTWNPETFGYAERYDEKSGRYQGLAGGARIRARIDKDSVLVKPEVAARQIAEREGAPVPVPASPAGGPLFRSEGPEGPGAQLPARAIRFHGSVSLDPTRLGRDASRIAEEVVQHLNALVGSEVDLTLEIHAKIPSGTPENIVRTVTENCRTLKFKDSGFEEE